jgi:hypothetical protein
MDRRRRGTCLRSAASNVGDGVPLPLSRSPSRDQEVREEREAAGACRSRMGRRGQLQRAGRTPRRPRNECSWVHNHPSQRSVRDTVDRSIRSSGGRSICCCTQCVWAGRTAAGDEGCSRDLCPGASPAGKCCWGPPPTWLPKAKEDADVIFSGSEDMMSNLRLRLGGGEVIALYRIIICEFRWSEVRPSVET